MEGRWLYLSKTMLFMALAMELALYFKMQRS
jgi:hypothetical protein